jgi:hypothetical protein
MKKFYVLLLFALLSATVCFSQKLYDREFKPFKMDFGVGYAMLRGIDIKGGPIFSIEPKYAFTGDAFTFGLRLQGAMLKLGGSSPTAANSGNNNGGSNATAGGATINNAQVNAHISASLTCDRYFSNMYVRPFVGAGPGFYSVATETGKSQGALLAEYAFSNQFGFMFRGGVEWGHVRGSVEYNFVNSETMSGYMGIKLGIFLGGGRFDLISGNRSPY